MSKKSAAKPSLKNLSTWLEKGDLIKIANSFVSDAAAQEILGSLSAPKKKILWDLICENLFSLSPGHAHVVVAQQPVAAAPEPHGPLNGLVLVEVPARRYGKRKKVEIAPSESEPEDSKENIVQLMPEDSSEKASIVLSCTKHFLAHLKEKEPANIRTVIDVLNHILSANISGEKAMQICENIWRKKWTGYVKLGAECFQYMLAAIVNNNCSKADVKRLGLFKEVVEPAAAWIQQAAPNMAACLTNKTVLSDSSSPALLARFFMLNAKYIEGFHNQVKKTMINQTKAEAKVYGQVYGIALSKASPDLQEVLKTKCIQDFIQKFINVQWDLKAQKMMPHGFLLEAFLEELYYSTVSNAGGFKLLLEAYEPLLWRNLSSANALQRATSTKLLYLMYPIEPPNTTRVDQEILTNRQNECILLSLEDPNHVVRLIAVKKIRNILSETWKVMPRPFRVAVCNAIFNKLAFDKSSPEIRREALITISSFISDDHYQMCLFLSKFFKFLKPSIYDENKQVRKAMLQVLLSLQNFRHPKAFADQNAAEGSRVSSCWDVVALHELVDVMATEESNSAILKMCVQVAFQSIHPTEPEKEKTLLNRVVWLIKQGQQVARNFYENSVQVLPTEDAIVFMTKVMGWLGAFYKEFDRKGKRKDEKGKKKEEKGKGRKRKAAELEETPEEEEMEPFEENQGDGPAEDRERMLEPVGQSLKKPEIVAGLLDIVMVLWVKHAKALTEKEHAEGLATFEATVQQSLEVIFREWKDNIQVLGPILYIGSMLPSKGMKRLLNFCVNRLKLLITNNGGVPDQEIKLLATGVCNWDSPDILLEMTGEWLTECLKKALSKAKKPKGKKAKSEEEEGDVENKASAGLLILEKVFTHPLAHSVIIKKSAEAMVALLRVCEGVKKVVERRVRTGDAVSMSDELVHSCFKRYVALINLIPPSGHFEPSAEFCSVIHWAEKTLLSGTPEEEVSGRPPLCVRLLSVVLRCAAIAAHKSQVSRELSNKVVGLCRKVLERPAASGFLVSSLACAVGALFVHGVLVRQGRREGSLPKDLLELTLPKLLSEVLAAGSDAVRLEALTEHDPVAKAEFKSNIEETYTAFYAFFPSNAVQLRTLDRAFVQAVFRPLLSGPSARLLGLPYFSEFLLNEFQHSSSISPDKFWTVVRELVQDGLGATPEGRAAVEVFLVVVGAKWPRLLPPLYVDRCHRLLAALAADAHSHPDDHADLNQSFHLEDEEDPDTPDT